MFDIGFSELLLVGTVALLVLGPERLPVAVRTVGRGLGKARRAMQALRAQVEQEIDMPGLDTAPLRRLEQEIRQGVSLESKAVNDPAPLEQVRERSA